MDVFYALSVQGILLSSHCLDRNVPYMFSLWQTLMTELVDSVPQLFSCMVLLVLLNKLLAY